jgi:hypothetical protein
MMGAIVIVTIVAIGCDCSLLSRSIVAYSAFADPLARAIRGQSRCLRDGLGAAEACERFPSSKKGTSQKEECAEKFGPFLQAFRLKALVPSWHKTRLIVGVFSLPKKVEL